MDEGKRHVNRSPLEKAGMLSKLWFWWLTPLFLTGYKRSLKVDDMYNVIQEDSSEYLSNNLEREWRKELSKLKEGKKPSLLRAMARVIGVPFMLTGLYAFFEEICRVLQPLLLEALIRFFDPASGMKVLDAYLVAGGISFTAVVMATVHHPYFYGMQRLGMRLRIATCSLIYKKSLRLSHSALSQMTTGHIVNLMSNDVSRFDMSITFLHFLWLGPLEAATVLYLLWNYVGVASLAGFSLLLLLIPVQGSMGKIFSSFRWKIAKQTDERVRLMSEILGGMRVIKMYCWENLFGALVKETRRKEILQIYRAAYLRASIMAPFFSSAKLMVFLTLVTYVVYLRGTLTSGTVFVVIGLYNVLRLILNLFVPMAIQYGFESNVAVDRIQNFLLLEELVPSASTVRPSTLTPAAEPKVTILNASTTWKETGGVPTLENISFEVRARELLAVIGPVGSSKSSLLMALLGELPLTEGSTVKLEGKVAYTSQEAWIFSASVRQNILFGLPFDEQRYKKVLKATALTNDLEKMPDGDQTLVGERGVSVSGGQKARISLARAIYFNADIYLLDDPLSAVDASVGYHLFNECICGTLRDKPRILVTHQLQYLKAADRILILKQGHVFGMGSYVELVKSGVDISSLLHQVESNPSHVNILKTHSMPTGGAVIATLEPVEKAASLGDDGEIPTIVRSCSIDESNLDIPGQVSKSLDKRYLSQFPVESELRKTLLSRSVDIKAECSQLTQATSGHQPSRRHITGSMTFGETFSLESLCPTVESLEDEACLDLVAPLQQEEEIAVGTVPTTVYLKYFRSGTGVAGVIFFVLVNVVAQFSYVFSDLWLSHWANEEEAHQMALKVQNAGNVTTAGPGVDLSFNILIYAVITANIFVFGLVNAVWMFHVMVSASENLHNGMFAAIVRCPVSFFDNNPVGRILNRFSKDIGQLDEILPLTLYDFLACTLLIFMIVVMAGVVNPWVFVPTTPLICVFIYLRRFYLRTSRDVKRLEGITRSPVFSHVSASLQGLKTIRAYGVEERFAREFDNHQDLHSEAWFLFIVTSRWLAIRLDGLCAAFITAVAVSSVATAQSLNSGLVGLTLTYAIGLLGLFQWGVRQSAEVENQMTSAERVMEYASLPPEAPLESDEQHKPPSDWPQHGIIEARDLSLRYSDDGPLVLKNLSFCIRSQEKVGIVGRTGAGKSSLIAVLFRLTEPTGTILLDGINTREIGLHDLRKKISIIPQDPVLFVGNVRQNLDPFHQHSDEALWQALTEVRLKQLVKSLSGQLTARISEGGGNFSVGQRQLICLARALLYRNKVLIIDEATANVDPRTDSLIQQTIRQKFIKCTVLTIAHRLHTIMDSDRIMVLKDGEIVEFDEPHLLLRKRDGLFSNLVSQTGKTEAERLTNIAIQAGELRDGSEEIFEAPNSHGDGHYREGGSSDRNDDDLSLESIS